MAFEGKRDGNFKKDRESNVWCKADGEKENGGPDGDVGLKETAVQMAKANGVRWYGHVLRRDDGHVLRKTLAFEVKGKRKRRRPTKTWKTQVEKESKSVGLEKKDAMNRARWRVGVRELAAGVNPATPVYGDKPGSKLD